MPNDSSPGIAELEDLEKYDPESRFRRVTGTAAIIITIFACALSLFHIYTARFGMMMDMKHRAVHLTMVMTLVFLLYPARKDDRKRKRDIAGDAMTALIGAVILAFGLGQILHLGLFLTVLVFLMGSGFIIYTKRLKFYHQAEIPYVDIALAILGASISLYIFFSYEQIVGRAGLPTTLDLVFGLLAILLIMEAARRAIGWDLPVLALLCLIYAYFGPYMPGFLAHRGYSVKRIIEHMYLGTEGIYGIPLGVVATYVFHFVLFGIFVAKTGLGQLFIDIAMAMAGRSTGGPAKVAVISSGLLGSINGSSIANTVTTGSFTIPLMKRLGYTSRFAGAVEATASTGGQITPPIMGAAAFIMAEMIGDISYIEIAAAATIPALLHYLGIGTMVHFQAAKDGLRGMSKADLPDIKKCLMDRGHLLLPLFLVVYLLVAGRSPFLAAFWGITSSVAISYLRKDTRLSLRQIIDALEWGTRSALSIGAACACVGFIVGTATLTGLGLSFVNITVNLAESTAGFLSHLDFLNTGLMAHGDLFFTLLYTMIACTILGSGLPTTATYIILSMIAAPALQDFNVPLLVSHMFVLYYGVLADVTPPVALAAYAAAGLAGSDPFRTGFTAFKLALAKAIVPFAFVYSPMLLLQDFRWGAGLISISSAALGIIALGAGAVGYLSGKLAVWERILMILSTMLLMVPGLMVKAIGATVFLLLVLYQKYDRRE